MYWFVVVLAGVIEIAWAQSIKASDGFTRLWPSALATGLTVAVVYTLAVAMRHLPTGTVYVVFTALLIQKGSPESRDPDKADQEEKEALAHASRPDTPWPVKKGGLILKLYSHSLSMALVILFILSFALHLKGSNTHANEEAALNHQPIHTLLETLVDPEFWYESFQNWQSEFLSIAALLVLSIFLRERGSPESKPVPAPHSMTGH